MQKILKFMLFKRYNALELLFNLYIYGLWFMSNDWTVFLLIIPASLFCMLLESIDRTWHG